MSAWSALCPGLILVAASACGGSARAGSPESGAGAGAAGGTPAGAASGAPQSAAGAGGGGSEAGHGGAGRAGTDTPRGGTGGKAPDETGGSASALSCDTPYTSPGGGPRPDGPAPFVDCSNVPTDDLIERFESFGARVPQTLYFEAEESIVFWEDPCSASLAETVARGPRDGLGTLDGQAENSWFYEASYCSMGLRRRERSLRCDYFDGAKLGDLEPSRYALFASLLWWREHANASGAAILGYAIGIGSATDWVELCTLEGTRGDFGLCDSIRVLRTRHVISANGDVRLGTPELVRTVTGKCH